MIDYNKPLGDRLANSKEDYRCTEWFPAGVTPYRDGVYECVFEFGGTFYNLFKDGVWYCGYKALNHGSSLWAYQPPLSGNSNITRMVRWRGLTARGEIVE